MTARPVNMLLFCGFATPAAGSVRNLRGDVNRSLPEFVIPEGESPYVGACPYPSGCGPDCGIRWKEANWTVTDCPMTCPAEYSLVCQDNSTTGDGRPPSAVCTAVGEGFKLVGLGGSRGITCCRCELDALAAVPAPSPLPEVQGQCDFDNEPIDIGFFWDPSCQLGDLGCDGDGKHVECRLCGGGDYVAVPCPASSCSFQNEPYIPYYWDSECELGMLGCWADGVHAQCRFCGDHPFTGVICPEGAMHRREAHCAFDNEPTIPYYWDPTCYAGKHGCNADGRHVECRFCGGGGFSDIHCPGSHVCEFENLPNLPYFWDPDCAAGMLGCNADGVHTQCRFCAERPFENVSCPEASSPPANACSWPQRGEPAMRHFWDETCQMGQLGCWADGIHAQCRFCGSGVYREIACPNVTSEQVASP